MAEDKQRVRGHDLGPTGEAVARNLKRLRGGWTLRALQQRLKDVDHEISASGLQKIEAGARRVDVDDLVALAVVLGVNPNALLFPSSAEGPVEVTGAKVGNLQKVWGWASAVAPIDGNPADSVSKYKDDGATPPCSGEFDMRLAELGESINRRLDEIGEDLKVLGQKMGIGGPSADGDD
ncbi:helix-turn-helix domain-containing protein [Arthrobacter bambusae]|uniref:helix-turn-helix domain-containing protein n=1 Tax=Arthrobacter bambusae TaxID=1338426 RepID=UPI002784A514|nr:helix-turn-helix transcriptional regulator [Arthrobacter bambusae]MDQ0030880.1 transcriptional regulator with XRE-family HTH domain [Arthrobacter bambusae]MDQ0099245.1 transcriptional regulator with XRE-family HTH domain [Arthrobacter bambusae]